MKLQEKTSLILIFFLIFSITAISLFVSFISLSSYSDLERAYIGRDTTLMAKTFNNESATLSPLVSDYGSWDDTYDFVGGEMPRYVQTNLLPETFKNLRVNLIVISNNNGDKIYAGFYDRDNHTIADVPQSILAHISPGSPLLNISDSPRGTRGILMTPEGTVIVASHPILHSNLTGPSRGAVIMGRSLDSREISHLAELTTPSLQVLRIDDPSLPQDLLQSLREDPRGTGRIVRVINETDAGGYVLIKDIYGNDALVLATSQHRDIYQQGITTTYFFILIVLAIGLFFGVTILFTLDRLVLSRIMDLSQQVSMLGDLSEVSKRIVVTGDDEFTSLAEEINCMLETVETTQRGLLTSEARFRELAELLPQIVFEMDMQGTLLFINRSGGEIFAIDDIKIKNGINVNEFLIPEDIARMHRGLALVVAGAKSSGEIYHLKKADGALMSAIVYTSPIIRNGKVTGFRGTVIDVTERVRLEEALIESQEYLQTLFWSVKAGIIVIDVETHMIVDANPAALEMIGTTKDNLINQNSHHFIPALEEEHNSVGNFHQSVDSAERELLTTDGKRLSIIRYVVPVMLQGRTCLLETFIDNTGRKKIEQDLRENTELLKGILQASPVGVFRLDARGCVTFINDMFTRITGISEEEIRGKYWVGILHKDDQGALLEKLTDSIKKREMVKAEARFIHTSGSVYWLLGQAVPLIDQSGELSGWVGTVNDITQQKKIENALKESEEKYRALTENTADILFSTDTDGRILYISPQIQQYGFDPSDLLNRNLTDMVFPVDRPRIVSFLKKEINVRRKQPLVFRILDKSGVLHWMEGKTSIKHSPDMAMEGMFGILRDITDRKRDEDAIHLANKKLNLMNDITRHDILNTLTGIFGLADMAVATGDRKEFTLLLNQIRDVGREIQRQITFTRDYQGVGVNAPLWQNVREVIVRATRNFSRPGFELVIDIEDTEIFADPLLEKVFYNLVDNALRYGEKVTSVRFFYQISDHGFALICEDDGKGIPADEKERIFERGVGQNTGMGLFLTREILLITGITIRENGVPREGARFEMLIPSGMWRFVKTQDKR